MQAGESHLLEDAALIQCLLNMCEEYQILESKMGLNVYLNVQVEKRYSDRKRNQSKGKKAELAKKMLASYNGKQMQNDLWEALLSDESVGEKIQKELLGEDGLLCEEQLANWYYKRYFTELKYLCRHEKQRGEKKQ